MGLSPEASAQLVGVTVGTGQSVTNNATITAIEGVEFTGNGGTLTNSAGKTIEGSDRIAVGPALPNGNIAATSLTINNSGTLLQDNGGTLSGILFAGNAVTSGGVQTGVTSVTGITINNLSTGVISSLQAGAGNNDRAISFEDGTAGAVVNNAGTISSAGDSIVSGGIHIGAGVSGVATTTGNITINNQSSGTIENTSTGNAISLIQSASTGALSTVVINNAGSIIGGSGTLGAITLAPSADGTSFGGLVAHIGGVSITNSGTIDGSGSGIAIDNSRNSAALAIASSGTIKGNVLFGTGGDTLTMTGGALQGGVTGQSAGDSIVFNPGAGNSASITGAVTSVPLLNVLSGTASFGQAPTGFSQLKLGGGAVASVAGNLAVPAGAVITTTVTGAGNTSGAGSSNLGQIHATGAVSLASGTVVTPVVSAPSGSVVDGARYILAQGGGAASVGDVTTTSTGLLGWSVLPGASLGQSADDIYLVAKEVNLAAIVQAPGLNPALNVLQGLVTSTDSRAQAVITQIGALVATPAALQTTVKQMTPDVSGARTQGAVTASAAVANVVGARMVAMAAPDDQTGIAAGDSLRGYGLWAQPFGFHGDQGVRDGVNGFTANTAGLAIGADAKVFDPLTLGLAVSYGKSWLADTGDLSGDKTSIDNGEATLYGLWQGTPWYVDAQLAYALDRFSTTRPATVGTISETARGRFDGNQYGATLGAGYPLPLGRFLVTPNASLAYALLRQDGYSETGAPTLGLSVAQHDDHLLRTGLGVDASRAFSLAGGTLVPYVRLRWLHDLHAVAAVSTAQFAFGGASFTTTGAVPARNTGVLGEGLTFLSLYQYSLSAEYDAEIKDRFIGQTALFTLRMAF